jgi:plastocyanin
VLNSFRTSLRLGALLPLVLMLAACGGGDADGTDGGGGATVAVTDGVVEISADDLAFDAGTITATAGEPFTVVLTNLESQPHNFAVYTTEGGDEIAIGDVINEGETSELQVEGLTAGTYYFQCDVHPEMNGSIVVEG